MLGCTEGICDGGELGCNVTGGKVNGAGTGGGGNTGAFVMIAFGTAGSSGQSRIY